VRSSLLRPKWRTTGRVWVTHKRTLLGWITRTVSSAATQIGVGPKRPALLTTVENPASRDGIISRRRQQQVKRCTAFVGSRLSLHILVLGCTKAALRQ
jgi:hypothetical protein